MKNRTATIAKIASDIAPLGFAHGQYVGVRYYGTAYNAMVGKRQDLYLISNTDTFSTNSPIVYEGALVDFAI